MFAILVASKSATDADIKASLYTYVVHVNVRTLAVKQNPGKGELLAAQLLRYGLTVCGLSKIRRHGTGQKQLGAYAVHYW